MQLAATVIYVPDVVPVLAFYRAAFGLETRFVDADVQLPGRVAGESYQFAELATEGGGLHFATPALGALLIPGFEYPNGEPTGVEIAFTVPDVDAAFARAVAAGAAPVRSSERMPWGQVIAYVRSVEGTYVGLLGPLPA